MKRYGVNSNIKEIVNRLNRTYTNIMSDKLAQRVAEIFVEEARKRIERSGAIQQDIDRFVNAISFEKINTDTYRIYAGKGRDEQLINDMWYLEFGSGVVGATHQHPDANTIGWKYDINNHGENGWFFKRSQENGNKNALIASGDKIYNYKRNLSAGKSKGGNSQNIRQESVSKGDEKSIKSKGIIAVRYFYDTMQEFDEIITKAMNDLGIKL